MASETSIIKYKMKEDGKRKEYSKEVRNSEKQE